MKQLVIFCLVSLFVFASCETTNIVYDDAIPIEEMASFQISTSLKVNTFNSKEVNWTGAGGRKIFIPSGEHRLTVGLSNYKQGRYTYSGGNLGFIYDFKPGHLYYITITKVVNLHEITIRITDRADNSSVDIDLGTGLN